MGKTASFEYIFLLLIAIFGAIVILVYLFSFSDSGTSELQESQLQSMCSPYNFQKSTNSLTNSAFFPIYTSKTVILTNTPQPANVIFVFSDANITKTFSCSQNECVASLERNGILNKIQITGEPSSINILICGTTSTQPTAETLTPSPTLQSITQSKNTELAIIILILSIFIGFLFFRGREK